MPIEYRIDHDDRMVRSRSWGIVTYEEAVAAYDGLLADPEFNPAYDQLGIHTEMEKYVAPSGTLGAIGRRGVFSENSFRAVVGSKDAIYGLLCMSATHHEIQHGHQNFQVFRDQESARQWLGEMRAQRDSHQPRNPNTAKRA